MTPAFSEALESLGLPTTPELLAGFDAFEEALYARNEVMNLTRIPREECWVRHFVDSLLFHDLIPPDSEVLDLGTGPGFPAWPLAWARSDLLVTALDSNGKMLGFLKEHPLSNLRVVQKRAEDWKALEMFDVVTGRALAPLAAQLELSVRACRLQGFVIPMRTPADVEEAERPYPKLGLELEGGVHRRLPSIDARRYFPIFRKVKQTPGGIPRRWSEIKAKPF